MAIGKEEDFEVELAQTRHEELLNRIKLLAIKEPVDNGLKEMVSSIERLVNKIMIPVPKVNVEAPIIKVERDNEQIIKSFNEIGIKLSEQLSELKKSMDEKPKEWEWTVTYNYGGSISTIKAKAK